MTISDLHSRFINFAKGMPAIAFSRLQLVREIQAIQGKLEGVFPDQPAVGMGDIPLPVYGLAYSAFLSDLKVKMGFGYVELDARIEATIHLRGNPSEIIRTYEVTTSQPIRLVLDYDFASRKLFWREQGGADTNMVGAWGPDAVAVLAKTALPAPQQDGFLQEVELPSIWTTKNMFINLLIALLPYYETGELAPWLTLLEPLQFDYDGDHVLVTASRAQIAVGGCDPTSITVEPDPLFPYGQAIPAPSFSADRVDMAVYLPKTRFIDFTAKVLQPAVMVNAGGGGLVKWSVSGAFGLKKLTADITTGIIFGGAGLTVTGNIGLRAVIDFLGAARAWIDGPSGLKLGLASASVLGSGDFASEIRLTADLTAGYVYGDLVVTQAVLTKVDFDVNTPLGWPIDDVAGEILDRVAKNEIKKLTGQVTHLGRWDFMGIPFSYKDSLGEFDAATPVIEGLAGVAAYTGIARIGIG
ncbi:hypothetical protein IG197_07310 [Aminobacter sp. SR38]|jgi:hypothetical protein|uniref:hypothetical protein n=1 Tax=Aminobacter sp. SR38 TaxID=2774562 RepID=UPI001786E61C|nr:hypothetical protein [Aminobacter sp. SR38]QOF72860.1 hypothetical protein IG197_07310 [Aminobacter sp. SR38]